VLGLFPNSVVMCLFDCCRQIPPRDGKGDKNLTHGQLHILHAVGPAKSATTRTEVNSLSDFTGEFLQRMKKVTEPYPTCLKPWLKYHRTAEVVDKMSFEFSLKLGVPISDVPSVVLPKRSFDDWGPEDIADWFKTLKLSKDYTSTILATHIDGSFVKLMVEEHLWVDCQITVPSDQMKIKFGFKKFT